MNISKKYMKLTLTNVLTSIVGAVAILTAFYLFANPFAAKATNATTIAATVATSSPASVTTSASTIFATSTCASRVITTVASPIMLTFSDNQGLTPTGTFGHLQAASTTQVYDAGLYGCGAFKAYSFVASTITVSETK